MVSSSFVPDLVRGRLSNGVAGYRDPSALASQCLNLIGRGPEERLLGAYEVDGRMVFILSSLALYVPEGGGWRRLEYGAIVDVRIPPGSAVDRVKAEANRLDFLLTSGEALPVSVVQGDWVTLLGFFDLIARAYRTGQEW